MEVPQSRNITHPIGAVACTDRPVAAYIARENAHRIILVRRLGGKNQERQERWECGVCGMGVGVNQLRLAEAAP